MIEEHYQPRRSRLALTGALWASVLIALAALPPGRFPVVWLLALTLPAGLFLYLQRLARNATALALAILAQVSCGYGALYLAGPLDNTAALAGTLLPPLAYVTARRQETDVLLALFLSFCVLLVGLMLEGSSVALLGYVLTASLTMRLETVTDLYQSRSSHVLRSRARQRGGPVLLSLACGLACLGIYPLLSQAPSLGTEVAGATWPRQAQVGLSPNFELSSTSGTPLNLRSGEMLRVRPVHGGPVPADLYLRCAFFDVPGMDSWTTEPFATRQRDTRSMAWQVRTPAPGIRTRGLEIQRPAGFGGLVFAPPGTNTIVGLGELRTEPSREWLAQDPQAGAITYEVEYQDLRSQVAGQSTDSRWRGLRMLPEELRVASFTELLDQIPARTRTSPARLADALSELLQDRCTYALQDPEGPHPYPLLNFLHGTQRRGYCMHFASALGILLRLAGVPCRIAVGLQGGEPDVEDPEVRIYDAQHAHAWVEIPFPELGWVVFDPTPPALLQGTGEALVPGPDEALAGDDNTQAGTDTLETLGGYLETITSQVWIWSVFLLLGLFAGLRPRLGRKNSATAMPTPARPARRMLESILRTLKTRGLPRPRGQTLDRYLHDLGAGAVLDHTALADSFDAYQEVRFGSREYDDRRASRLGEGLSVARTAYKREKDSD